LRLHAVDHEADAHGVRQGIATLREGHAGSCCMARIPGFLETGVRVGYPRCLRMAGSKTRPGFSGGDEPPPSNPEQESSPRAARTVIGRPLHLHGPADPRPAPRFAPIPRAETPADVPEIVTDETTEKLSPAPRHTGKSSFPAFARLFGRWTTGGGFLSRSRLSRGDGDLPDVPREAWISRVAIFIGAAVLSFLVALAALKVHRCVPSLSRPSATTQASAAPAPPTPPSANAAPVVLPEPDAGAPAAASRPPLAAAPGPPTAPPPGIRRMNTHRPATRAGGSSGRAAPGAAAKPGTRPAQPDSLPPNTEGKDALLPLRL
jgi:hypothetical protein